jgi:hypothetical protein
MAISPPKADSDDKNWKSDRFLNVSVPTANGGTMRLFSVGLKLADKNHKTLIDWLDQDPEANTKELMKNLIGDFRSAEKVEQGFDFISAPEKA